MSRQKINLKAILAVVFVLLLTGCVSIPDAIKGNGNDISQNNLLAIMAAPQLYTGQQVRFGGEVVAVDNLKDNTRLEIAVRPLDRVARPILNDVSVGRIYASVAGFLDPVDYRGQLVTVLGTVAGTQQGVIGEKSYRFLVVNVTGYQRWQVIQQFLMPTQDANPWFWGSPWYHSGPWGWYPRYPVQLHSVVTK